MDGELKQGDTWIIIYTDGSTFSHLDGTPWDAPRQGIGLIGSYCPTTGFQPIFGRDYFYYEREVGGWHTCDQFGLYDHLIRAKHPCPGFGRMMSDENWASFFRRTMDFMGPKQGWLEKERPWRTKLDE